MITNITEFTKRLKFEIRYNNINQDDHTFDFNGYLKCNELTSEEFKSKLETLLEEDTENISDQSPKKETLDLIVQLEVLKSKLFLENTFIGKTDLNNSHKPHIIKMEQEEHIQIRQFIEPNHNQDDFTDTLRDTIQSKISSLSQILLTYSIPKEDKLEWNVGPTLLAAMIVSLEKKGWIKAKTYNSDFSPGKTATLCSKIFTWKKESVRSLTNALGDTEALIPKLKIIKLQKPNDVEGY
jgi:hypothetical protein